MPVNQIGTITSFTAGTIIVSADVNTINTTFKDAFNALITAQNELAGGLSVGGSLTIASGGFTVTAGGIVLTAGVLSVDDATDTTSTTTGSIHSDGGIAAAKALWVGTTSRLVGNVTIDAGLLAAGDDQGALGASGAAFSDLFLASGAVINFSAGDVTLTHSAAKLTWGGDGAVEIDFNDHEMTSVDINSGAIDGTTIGAASAANGTFAAVVGTTANFSGDVTAQDQVTIGGSIEAGSIFNIEPGVAARDILTGVGTGLNIEADTQAINAAGNGETVAIGALAFLGIPTWTSVGTTFTITDAATLYIQGVPVDSTNVTHTREYALWVDAGLTRLDGNLEVRGTGASVIGGGPAAPHIGFLVQTLSTSTGTSNFAAANRLGGTITGFSGDTDYLTGTEIKAAIATQSASESIGVISQLRVSEPQITDNLTGDVTVAATVHIVNAPDEGESNYALWVDAGDTRLDGGLSLGTNTPTGTVGDLTMSGDLVVSGTGPHAIGGATNDFTQLYLSGSFASLGGSTQGVALFQDGTLTGADGDITRLSGSFFAKTITTQTATESVGVIAQMILNEPGITDNLTGDITVAATLYVVDAPTEGETNAALYVAAGAVWIPTPSTVAGTGLMVTANSAGTQEIMRDSSSARFKKDIVDAVIDVRAVLAINSKAYSRQGSDGRYLGFIAEDFHDAGFGDILAYDEIGPAGFLEFGRGITALHHAVLQSHDDRIRRLERLLPAA